MNSRKILIVEDEPDVCAALQSFLGRRKFSVATTPSGTNAIQIIATFQPDLVFLDITLLDLSGIEVLRRIREAGGSVPVVIMTGQLLPEVEISAIKALGITAYLQKPVILSDLEVLLLTIFKTGSGGMTVPATHSNHSHKCLLENSSHKIANLLGLIRIRSEGFLLNENDGFNNKRPVNERLEEAKGILEDTLKTVDQIAAALDQMRKKE